MTKASTRKQSTAQKPSGPWLTAANWLLVGAAALVPFATGYVPFAGRAGIFIRSATVAQSAAFALLIGGALLCWAVALIRGEVRLKPVPYGWVLAAFLVVVLASAVTALDKTVAIVGSEQAQQGLLTMAAYGAVFVLATQIVEGRRYLLRILEALALAGAVVALFGVLQSLGLPFFPIPLERYLTTRGSSTLGNPDTLGTFLIVPLLISLGLSVATTGRQRWVWMACVAVTSASLLLTQTRGAWLGALVALVIFSVVLYRSPRQSSGGTAKWVAAGLILFVGVSVAVFKAATGAQSILSRLTPGGAGTDGGRLFLWSEVLKVIGKYPLLGAGPDNFLYAWYKVSTSAQVHLLGVDGVINEAHNYWLGMAVSSGILAALLLVGFVALVLVGSRSAIAARLELPGSPDRVAYSALWAGVVGLCVALMFAPFLTPIGLTLWLSLGLLAVPKVRALDEGVSASRMRYTAVAVAVVLGLLLVGWGGATGLSSSVEYVGASSRRDPLEAQRMASRIAPWRQAPLLLEAQLLEQRGASPEEVAAVLDQLIAIAPREQQYYVVKGQVLNAQPARVIATANEGLAVYPASLRLMTQRALAQSMLGDSASAERDAAAAWRLARDVVPAHQDPFVGGAYAQILLQEGKTTEAKVVLDELQATFPGNAAVEKLQSVIASGGK